MTDQTNAMYLVAESVTVYAQPGLRTTLKCKTKEGVTVYLYLTPEAEAQVKLPCQCEKMWPGRPCGYCHEKEDK